MSWEATIPPTVPEGLAEAVDAAEVRHSGSGRNLDGTPLPPPLVDGVEDQIAAARAVVKDLAASGALGTEPLTASLKGHANEDHAPHEGAVKDHITISVGQV